MEKVYKKIALLREDNARHVKSGWRFKDAVLTDTKVCEHIASEVVELAVACEELNYGITDAHKAREQVKEEVADVLNTALHMAARHNIGYEEIVVEMERKLDLRFVVD